MIIEPGKAEIERALRKDTLLNIYSIGDLDDFYWPYTRWFTSMSGGEITETAMLYEGQALPTLLALSRNTASMERLVRSILPDLPKRFFSHLSPGIEAAFYGTHDLEPFGGHLKMALTGPSALEQCDDSTSERLTPADLEEVQEFYARCYPGNWFDSRMLETRMYFGMREDGKLACVAGVHVFSREYGVAALGNIATDPERRNRGLGRCVTARVCRELLSEVIHIGLNVRADNAPAIACYRGLGFAEVAQYGEFMVSRK